MPVKAKAGNTTALTWLYLFLAIPVILWIGFSVWAFSGRFPSRPDEIAFLAFSFGVIGGLTFPFYIALLGWKVLPSVDERVHPEWQEHRQHPDNLVFKMLRLNEYAAAITSKRARRLNPLPVDLRTLPDHLRIPIVVYLYWMVIPLSAALLGGLGFYL